jgi:hypothetical protein
MNYKSYLFIYISFLSLHLFSQEQPVKLQNCQQQEITQIENCFLTTINDLFKKEFKLPINLDQSSFNQDFSVVFIASKEGVFDVVYIKSDYKEIKKEVRRVFSTFPKFTPAKYNNHPIDKSFILPYSFNKQKLISTEMRTKNKKRKKKYSNKLYNSNSNIPLTHQNYRFLSNYEFQSNIHTAIKPYIYNEISQNIDFDSLNQNLFKNKPSWFGRKLWDENLLSYQGTDYWFQLDPILDLRIGKENENTHYTYINTRGVNIVGGLGKKFSFSSTILESQGKFANYFRNYAKYKKPDNDAFAIVPAFDIAKQFKTTGFDFPLATGYISYAPFSFMNIQFGHDKNFIGDGYRSLFLSDVGAPYTFVKINTKFWKIQYTNLWTWLRDVNTTTADDEPYKRKYMAMHYLSWNATKKLNIGLFESVTWAKTAERGFDPHYLNPVIIYRALEFSNGSKAGNATIGLSANYHLFNTVQLYSQFILDELTMEFFLKGDGYWGNKYGFELGVKYYDAFNIPNLNLQVEYNQVQPYTYSHSNPVLNYGHANQALAHLWESNFNEFTTIASYQKKRWFANAKLIFGNKGFDFNSETDNLSYGGDIFRSNDDKTGVFGVKFGQGNKAKIAIGDLQIGYLINPASNLKVFGNLIYRDFSSPISNSIFQNKTTTWFNIGIRTDINNWYFDF